MTTPAINEMNETMRYELLQTMIALRDTRDELMAIKASGVGEVKAKSEALDKLMVCMGKAYEMQRLSYGINDKAPAVQINNNKQYVISMPEKPKDDVEWMQRYGGRILEVESKDK